MKGIFRGKLLRITNKIKENILKKGFWFWWGDGACQES
jgi:hypothetical protein